MSARNMNTKRQAKRTASECDDKKKRDFRKSRNTRSDDKSKNYSSSARGSQNVYADSKSGADMPGINDISWYSKYPELLSAAASIPFPYKPGMAITGIHSAFESSNTPAVFTKYSNGVLQIPGVLAIHWAPMFGMSSQSTDPASVLAKEIYARVRSKYSGSLDCDAPDFVMYLGALDSIFAYIAYLKRLYRILGTWSPNNYAIPDTLLAAMNIGAAPATELRINRKALLEAINLLVMQSRKFTCPAVMDYFNRHYWMSDNVFCDTNSARAQLYIFVPDGFYTLSTNMIIANDPTGSDTAAGLQMHAREFYQSDASADGSIVKEMYNFGLSMIQALDAWDDGYTISGYLQRAFEGQPSFVVDLLDESATQDAVYSEEVLTQIENIRAVGGGGYNFMADNHFVIQNVLTNAIYSMPYVTHAPGVSASTLQPMLSLRTENPTAGDVVIASRLHSWVEDEISKVLTKNGMTANGHYVHCASELVTEMAMFITPETESRNGYLIPSITNSGNAGVDYLRYFMLQQFDWHPLIVYVDGSSTSDSTVIVAGDTNNITVIAESQMDSINRVCLLSEFSSFSI